MATLSQAAFTINGTPSVDPVTGDREYSAVLGETLTCTLEVNPSLANSATFEVFDPNDLESPFASKNAPLRTWNENSLPAITVGKVPLGINDSVTIDMPPLVAPPLPNIHSYVIRCTVSTPGDGSPLSQVQVFERQVLIFGTSATPPLRKTVPGETTQARARAWSDSLNDLIDAMENLIVVTSGSLQAAYIAGNTIAVSAAEGPLSFSSTVAATTSPLDVSMDGTTIVQATITGGLDIGTVAGQGVSVVAGAGGLISIDSPSGEVQLRQGGATFLTAMTSGDVFMTARRQLNLASAAGQGVNVSQGVLALWTISPAGATNIRSADDQSTTLRSTATGDVNVDAQGTGDVNIDAAGGSLILGVGSGGSIAINPAGAITLTPTAGQDGNVTATGAGALNLTSVDGDASLTTSGSGDVLIGAVGTGNLIVTVVTGNISLDAVAGELTFDDVGNSGLTLSQAGDRVLDEVAVGEVLNGAASAIGSFNRLARASTLLSSITGLHLENSAGTPDEIIDIDAGRAASDDGTFQIVSAGTLTPDITAAGANGLDTGVVAADTWYSVWLIGDTTGASAPAGMFSLSFTEAGLTFPGTYDSARRVGAVRTDGTSDILIFGMPKAPGAARWTYWKEETAIQITGTATTYTDTTISAATRVPPSAVRQQVGMFVTKLGGGSNLAGAEIVPDSWNEVAGNVAWRVGAGFGGGGDPSANGIFEMPVGPTQVVRYLVSPVGDAQVTISVKGWEDSL